ncbi:hypothetical protein MFLAVUS_008922 [Mucor flavus]|uniref:FAD-binding domain-containing protein n=1 Tax=Mucor flavus TaxID=439312 RepID=A0ABP9Z8M4_9FUNG
MSNNIKNKVIIVGGGLAGLTLANSLQMQGIPFEVYERDESPDSRMQGWGITLHFCLPFLRKCVPEEAFENFSQKVSVNPESKDGGMSFTFHNANTGEVMMSMKNEPGTAYRAHRYRLRNWLLKQVESKVHWNKRVDRYEENAEQKTVTAFFTDGTQVTGDVLVATDGVMSPIACQLLGGKEKFDAMTNTLDVRSFGVLRRVTEEEWLKVAEGPTHLCINNGQQIEDDDIKQKTFNSFCSIHDVDRSDREKPFTIFWSLSRYDPDGVVPKFDGTNNTECLNLMKTWARNGFPEDSPFRQLIVNTPEDVSISPLVVRDRSPPSELVKTSNGRVVLVGDAAHPMTIFKGEGGNHAIIDAANLAEQLGEFNQGKKTLQKALTAYNSEMIPRGQKGVKESHDSAIMVHCNAEVMMRMFKKRS